MTALAINPIALEWRRLLPIAEAAARLTVDAGHLARVCRERLEAQGLAVHGRHPDGGQIQWFVSRDYDARLIDGPIGDGYQEPDLSAYTQRQRTEAINRRAAVEIWTEAKTSWSGSTAQILERVLTTVRQRMPGLKISRSRLYAWATIYRRPADTLKLIDVRGGNRRGMASDIAWGKFKDLYLHENRPSIRRCWMEVDRLAKEQGAGWTWCSLKSCHALLNDRITPEVQSLHREPEKWRTQLAPFIPQNTEAWGAGEVWIGDHKQLDCICTFGGQKIRPWVTAWMDWRTRRVVGWVLSDNPNSSTILAALRHGLKEPSNFGGPRIVWIDNGKDYDSWLFHGQTKKQRRESITDKVRVDEGSAFGIFKALTIEPHFATPYNANGKARLERWFRTLEAFCKTYATYTGESIDVRPQRLNEILENPRSIPSFADVYARLKDHIAGSNARTDHEMDDLVDGGERLSPDQAFARWCDTRRILADPAALDLLMQQWHRPVAVTRKGVTINVQGQALSYGNFETALSPYKAIKRGERKPVLVAYDPHALQTVRIYTQEWRFICTCAMNQLGGAHGDDISIAHVAELNRQKATYKRSLKHVAASGITSTLTNEEHLAQIAAEAKAPPVPTSNDQTMKIVSTPLDGQAREVDREKVRTAVGAEKVEYPVQNPMEVLRRRINRDHGDEEIGDPFAKLRERNNAW